MPFDFCGEPEQVDYLTTFFYTDGTSETVIAKFPKDWPNADVYGESANRRTNKNQLIKFVDGPHEQKRFDF